MARDGAVIGISDHGGWAVLVTVTRDGTVLDRRRIELVDADLPKMPHHHECQTLPIAQGVALVERVRVSAQRLANETLEAVATALPGRKLAVALRECPAWLPPTVDQRIQDYRAMCVADWVMYRQALAVAAEARGWTVHWYDAKKVLAEASEALGVPSLEPRFRAVKAALGPPWTKDHKIAMAAAIVATNADPKRRPRRQRS